MDDSLPDITDSLKDPFSLSQSLYPPSFSLCLSLSIHILLCQGGYVLFIDSRSLSNKREILLTIITHFVHPLTYQSTQLYEAF